MDGLRWMSHEKGWIPHESGWIPHEIGWTQHKNKTTIYELLKFFKLNFSMR
jgi:hypothetical protein